MKMKFAAAVATFTTATAFASNAFASICLPIIGCIGGGGSGGDTPAAAPEINAVGALPVIAVLFCVAAIVYRRYRKA